MNQEIPKVASSSFQQIFDFVVSNLLKQNAKSVMPVVDIDYSPSCSYRGEDGKKCAAGFLIPDDKYEPRFEHQSVCSTPVIRAIIEDFDRHNKNHSRKQEFIRQMQSIHDTYEPEEWPHQFQKLAKKKRLTYKF